MSLLLAFLLCLIPAHAEDGVDPELQEIQKHAADMEQAVQKAMGVLPGMGQSPDASGMNPLQQKAMALASDKNFIQAAQALWTHPNRNTLFLSQLGFFVFMLFFKSWRQTKNKHWFKRVFAGLFYSMVTWVGISAVLPYFLLGEPFRIVVRTIWSTFV